MIQLKHSEPFAIPCRNKHHNMSQFLLQCITMDGIDMSHLEQVEALCKSGAKWIQLRMKNAPEAEVESVARKAMDVCRNYDAILVINDYLNVALQIGAEGVHLGKEDMDWKAARELAGPDMVMGGTVNSLKDARAAVASESLDYVGVGPYRFTNTKENLAQVLEKKELSTIIDFLGEIPAVVIGGVVPDDLEDIANMDAEGVAISSGLFVGGDVTQNVLDYVNGWPVDEEA